MWMWFGREGYRGLLEGWKRKGRSRMQKVQGNEGGGGEERARWNAAKDGGGGKEVTVSAHTKPANHHHAVTANPSPPNLLNSSIISPGQYRDAVCGLAVAESTDSWLRGGLFGR